MCEVYFKVLVHGVVQFSSVVQSCPTLCDPMNSSMPGLPVHHQLPEFTQTPVHWVSNAIQPSHPLLAPSPTFNLSQYQGLFQWSCMDVRVGLWRKLRAEELMLLNCGAGEDSWECLGQQGDKIKTVSPKGNQSWIFTGRTDAEAVILWLPDVKNWLIGKEPDAGRD